MAIPKEHTDALVDASLHLMRTLANVYGSERAMEFWGVLGDTIDPDLKGLTFAAMLTGRQGQQITINSVPVFSDKIAIIKAIRTWDRRVLSLKDAKDMIDGLINNGKEIKLEITYGNLNKAKQDFQKFGCSGIGL